MTMTRTTNASSAGDLAALSDGEQSADARAARRNLAQPIARIHGEAVRSQAVPPAARDHRASRNAGGQAADIAVRLALRGGRTVAETPGKGGGAMDHTSIDLCLVIDTFLLLLIGVGPKIALVPY